MNLERYNHFFKQVIDWNHVIGITKAKINDPQTINLYQKLTDEELQETFDAIQAQDSVEIKDGVFDVFVTGSMLNYLHTGFSSTIYSMKRIPVKSKHVFTDLITDIGSDIVESYPAHISLLKLISIAEQYFGTEEMDKVFVDGIESNNSKIIFDITKSNLKKQLAFANAKYEGQYENLKLVNRKYGPKKRTVYVIRADYGEGKLLKPESFNELQIREQNVTL